MPPSQDEATGSTPVVMGLRPQDPIPAWSTHLAYVENDRVVSMGEKASVVDTIKKLGKQVWLEGEERPEDYGIVEKAWAEIGIDNRETTENQTHQLAEPLVEM